MKKTLGLLILLTCSFTVAQTAYSDNFDKSIKNLNTPKDYNAIIKNDNLLIICSGSRNKWASLDYKLKFNNSGEKLDLIPSPKVYIKAKASSPVELRIDLRDRGGYTTNKDGTSSKLTTQFKVHEFNFSGKFLDGGYGGPCKQAPCAVNPLDITNFNFIIAPGVGKFKGKIEIDWISVGAPLEIENPNKIAVRYNQVGYVDNKEKIISLTCEKSFETIPYSIVDEKGNEVSSGTTEMPKFWEDGQQYVTNVSIKNLNEKGTYTFKTSDTEITFIVDNNPYKGLAEASLKYYYSSRASTKIEKKYGKQWSRSFAIPDDKIYIHKSAASENRPENTIISSPKGWFDAGDYNKYIVNAGITAYTLLAAYEHFPDYYNTKTYNIPESNNALPDILDEVLWSLEWFLKMQDPEDGGVYHKLTGLKFSPTIKPSEYKAKRYVVQKSVGAALNFAAVTAIASRIFKDFENEKPGFSQQLIDASVKAYKWAIANPEAYYVQPSDVSTGEYGDNNVTDEFRWAATELFITTQNEDYLNAIKVEELDSKIPSWNSVDPLALISIIHHESLLKAKIETDIAKNKLLKTASVLRDRVINSEMKISMSTQDYVWGGNGNNSNQILLLIRSYEATKDKTYLDAAYITMDYILGRNGTGYCFATGFGEQQVFSPHHRLSASDGVDYPIPGMLSGGPNPRQDDQCSGYPNNHPATSFVDDYCSYASNEIAINWNAPFAYIMNALSYYSEK